MLWDMGVCMIFSVVDGNEEGPPAWRSWTIIIIIILRLGKPMS